LVGFDVDLHAGSGLGIGQGASVVGDLVAVFCGEHREGNCDAKDSSEHMFHVVSLALNRETISVGKLRGPKSGGKRTLLRAFRGVKEICRVCRCSKIMSPHNCNETLSPSKDGDDESERVPTGESD